MPSSHRIHGMVTEPFDSYPFDRGGEGQEGPSQYRDPTSKEVFSNIAADIGRIGVVSA